MPLPRVILAHDWLVARRGGEQVLEAMLAALSGRARVGAILTMFDTGGPIAPGIDAAERQASVLNALPGRMRRWLLPVYPVAVASLARELARLHRDEPVDLVISSHSAAIKALRPPGGVPHLCYCHTPARYVWSQRGQYGLASLPLALAGPAYRRWDRLTASRVTRFLANSTHTAEQIRRCYGRESIVLFPPVRTDVFTPDAGAPRGGHWLVAGALTPYKRVDLAIAAAHRAGHPLRVVGRGPERRRLERLAGPTVSFIDAPGDDAFRRELRSARLLLHPQIEDFGITAVEAQACGTPVVALGHGGARDTVIDGLTGALVAEQSAAALLGGIARCPRPGAPAIRAHAERFDAARFADGFLDAVDGCLVGREDRGLRR
jgi:glycosyltransferase involved in cell wall biosynthesis